MKKLVFVITMFFALLLVSDTILAQADTEYDTALKYYNSGKYKEAVEHLKDYVKKNPYPAAYYLMGYALYKLKRFDEAAEYFNEAYLIDPNFSLEKAGLIQKLPEEKAIEPSGEQVPPKQKPPVPESKVVKPEVKEPIPVKQPSKEIQPRKPEAPKVTPEKKAPLSEPKKVEPQKKIEPPAAIPALPKPGKAMPSIAPALLTGLFAGFAMFFLAIYIALYVYGCLCLFLIAKKLNVPYPWTAWVPFVQVWTFVTSAGKPWWWILLLLIPIVNLIVLIYLWVCITEKLGRNKWLGLLILAPVVNLVFIGILAFSKTEGAGGITPMDETVTLKGTPLVATEDEITSGLDKTPPTKEVPPEEQF